MKLSSLEFFKLFNFKTPESRGRIVMITGSIMDSIIGYLTTGIFYTSFLIGNDIDIVDMGILTFLPYITSLLSLLAPTILERMPRRKWYLFIMTTLSSTVSILGTTLLPVFVQDKEMKTVGFAIIVVVAGVLSSLTAAGYSVWHLNFIPEEVRAGFYSIQQVLNMVFAAVTLITSSAVADALSGTPHELEIITTFRYIGFALTIIKMILMLLPKEYPYPRTQKVRLRDVFVLPLKNKKFMFTMSIIAMWQFSGTFSSLFSYYLLNDCKVPYTFINVTDAAYALFLIFLSPFWVKFLKKTSWLKTLAITAFMIAPVEIFYSFANASNYFWIMLIAKMTAHVIGVGQNLAYANVPNLALPEEGRSNYLVFYSIVVSISAFIGTSTVTAVISLTEGMTFNIFGADILGVQLLRMIEGCLKVLIGIYLFKVSPKFGLMPEKTN